MKKIVTFILICLIVISFCGCSSNITNDNSNPIESTPTAIQSSPTPLPTPSATEKIGNKSILDDKFVFTHEDILNAITTTFEEPIEWYNDSFTHDKFDIFWTSAANIREMSYVDSESNKLQALILLDNYPIYSEKFGYYNDDFFKYAQSILGLCGIEKNIEALAIENLGIDTPKFKITITEDLKQSKEKNVYETTFNEIKIVFIREEKCAYFIFMPEKSTMDIGTLSLDVEKKECFLSDEERLNKINSLIKEYKYNELLNIANEYIEDTPPASDDPVFKIKELCDVIVPLLKECNVEFDDFSETSKVYYKGLNKISTDNNFVTFIEDGHVYTEIGFRAKDWLFFDRVEIKIGTDDYIWNSYQSWNIITDTAGSGVTEKFKEQYDEEEIEKIASAENPIIRFSNSESSEYIDHTFTDTEKQAIKVLPKINDTAAQIIHLIYVWESL